MCRTSRGWKSPCLSSRSIPAEHIPTLDKLESIAFPALPNAAALHIIPWDDLVSNGALSHLRTCKEFNSLKLATGLSSRWHGERTGVVRAHVWQSILQNYSIQLEVDRHCIKDTIRKINYDGYASGFIIISFRGNLDFKLKLNHKILVNSWEHEMLIVPISLYRRLDALQFVSLW